MRTKLNFYLIALLFGSLANPFSLSAAVITIDEEVSLTDLINGGGVSTGLGSFYYQNLTNVENISVGDVIDLSIRFTGGERLSLTNNDGGLLNFQLFGLRTTDEGPFIQSSIVDNRTLDFFDFSGANTPLNSSNTIPGAFVINPVGSPELEGLLGHMFRLDDNINETVVFSGFRSQYTVDQLQNGNLSNIFNQFYINFHDVDFQVLPPVPVPEPGSMLLLGLIGAGGACRRKWRTKT